MFLLNMITMGERKGIFEEMVLKGFNYYLLASLTAIVTTGEVTNGTGGGIGYKLGGLIMIYLYLIGRMQNQRIMMQFQRGMSRFRFNQNTSRTTNTLFLIGTLALYSVSLIYPEITQNAVVEWFYESIIDIYDNAFLGFIFKIIGVFFLISIIFRGIMQTQQLVGSINKRMDKRNGDGKDDDEFDDYEIVD